MGEVGKKLLREHIKHKRTSEGLDEVSDDLSAKKPRYDVSDGFFPFLTSLTAPQKEEGERERERERELELELELFIVHRP